MSDPEDPNARLRGIIDQIGPAINEAFKTGMRQALAKQIAEDHGPGPWVLHPDGRVTPHLTVVPDPQTPNRILWNKRGDDIDEIVLRDVAVLHVEQMDDRCWWIGVNLANGGYWAGNFIAKSRGPMRFTEQEMTDFEWDADAAHDEPKGDPS
jgi:hypothetical protein